MRLAISAWSIVWTDTIFASGKTEFLATQKRNTDRFSWVGVLKEGIYENKKQQFEKYSFLIFAFVQLNTSQLTQLPLYGGCTVWNTSARLSGRPFFLWTGSHFWGMPFFIEFEREAIFSTFCEHLRVEAIFSVFEPHWRESIEQWLQSGPGC